jgi:hypothetical protein
MFLRDEDDLTTHEKAWVEAQPIWNKVVLEDFRVQKWHKKKLENLIDF